MSAALMAGAPITRRRAFTMGDPTTQLFTTDDGLSIAWYFWPATAPKRSDNVVVLVHGFVASAALNWMLNDISGQLAEAGFDVVAYDLRGHGASSAPHDADAYGEAHFVADLRALLDEIGAERVDLVGYAMGASIAAITAAMDARVGRLVLGGVGAEVLTPELAAQHLAPPQLTVDALQAEHADDIEHVGARRLRGMADLAGADLVALAAAASRRHSVVPDFSAIGVPVLILCGSNDPLAPQPESLVTSLRNAHLVTIPGDHFDILSRPDFTAELERFLALEQPASASASTTTAASTPTHAQG